MYCVYCVLLVEYNFKFYWAFPPQNEVGLSQEVWQAQSIWLARGEDSTTFHINCGMSFPTPERGWFIPVGVTGPIDLTGQGRIFYYISYQLWNELSHPRTRLVYPRRCGRPNRSDWPGENIRLHFISIVEWAKSTMALNVTLDEWNWT
jgi:hypothetical protein